MKSFDKIFIESLINSVIKNIKIKNFIILDNVFFPVIFMSNSFGQNYFLKTV